MVLQILLTLLLGGLAFRWGMRGGQVMVRQGATAQDLFKGKEAVSLLAIGLYIGLLVVVLNVPQMPMFPLEWRVYGMQITWTLMRVFLLGFCGVAWWICHKTAPRQVMGVILVGLLGLGSFTVAEGYFLAPIHGELVNHLQPNGVFRQASMSSCAPAALATILRRWDIDATEVSAAQLAGTSRLGTSMPQLIAAARGFGMDGVELSPSWEQIRRINRPGILSVWLVDGVRKLPHAVALLGMQSDRVAIGDPARGKIYLLNQAEFQEIWRRQYLPIFRVGEDQLSADQAIEALTRQGFLTPPDRGLSAGIRRFQTAIGLPITGALDPITSLSLSGPSLEQVPTLQNQIHWPHLNSLPSR